MLRHRILILVFLLSLFDVLGCIKIWEISKTFSNQTINITAFRNQFFDKQMMSEIEQYPIPYQNLLKDAKKEAKYFPVPESSLDSKLNVSYINSWMDERNYGGKRRHEGIDLMASKNIRGLYPVVSICDGIVTNIGWSQKGGYRVGISSESGLYYYYAHLDSYANVQSGDWVRAGQLLGFMGDSGYGKEGTKGKFDVHLHVGLYYYVGDQEYSLNPYYLLKFLENHKLKYAYL